jgi:ribonuclease P protein subunit RPR2
MVYTCTSCQTSRRIPAPPILEEDTDMAMDDVPSHESTSQVSKPLDSDSKGVVVAMDVTAGQGAGVEGLTSSSGRRGKSRKKVIPRKPPLFAREAGHVVFCGNEKLDNAGAERGNGIYIV